MGSEAVLVSFDTNEVYELGKFASSWLGEDGVDWSRTDAETFYVRIARATIVDREHSEIAKARGVAAELFAFLERVDWKVECLNEQDPRYEDAQDRLVVIGNRYDAKPIASPGGATKAVDDAMAVMEAGAFNATATSEERKATHAAFAEAMSKMTQAEKEETVRRCEIFVGRLELMRRRGSSGPAS